MKQNRESRDILAGQVILHQNQRYQQESSLASPLFSSLFTLLTPHLSGCSSITPKFRTHEGFGVDVWQKQQLLSLKTPQVLPGNSEEPKGKPMALCRAAKGISMDSGAGISCRRGKKT